jgi:hypothetical protein
MKRTMYIYLVGDFETKIKKQTTMKINPWRLEKELGECQKQFVKYYRSSP